MAIFSYKTTLIWGYFAVNIFIFHLLYFIFHFPTMLISFKLFSILPFILVWQLLWQLRKQQQSHQTHITASKNPFKIGEITWFIQLEISTVHSTNQCKSSYSKSITTVGQFLLLYGTFLRSAYFKLRVWNLLMVSQILQSKKPVENKIYSQWLIPSCFMLPQFAHGFFLTV